MPVPHRDRDWRELSADEFEDMRHAFEVNHCLREGYDFTVAHCQGVREKRGRESAERLWRDVRANWLADKEVAQSQLALLTE